MIEIKITGETPRAIAKEVEVLYAAFCVQTKGATVEIDMGDEPAEAPAPKKKAPAKKAAAKQPEPDPAPEPETEPEVEQASGEITLDDVRAAVTKGVAAIGPDAVKALFADLGAKSGKDLADDKRGEFIQAVENAVASANG